MHLNRLEFIIIVIIINNNLDYILLLSLNNFHGLVVNISSYLLKLFSSC